MLHPRLLSTAAFAVIALAAAAPPALSADPAAKKRCADLVAYYDRWGATRSEHTDGARNHRRIAAEIDCQRGDYPKGIERMEALLHDKGFDVPSDVGEGPMYFPNENPAQALKPR
jgi:hypothetical protein